ncbi:MAG: 2'-5' RNA ligase family protein [Myxococcales bacterium]|nr:2'-5' RNA ligase family protein [Myxococcales bacterium]
MAAREIPRATGVELLAQAFELDATAADRAMGEAGRTWFTAPEPTHAAEMDAMRADLAKAQASLRGHQAYTARLIQRAKAGGLELGAFTAREPTEVGEGDVLEQGDVVAVPVQDGRTTGQRVDAHTAGVAVVLELPSEAAAGLPTETSPKNLHVTLAVLDDAPEASDVQARLIETVRSWAQSVPQIAATLGGIGRFPAGPDGEPVYVLVDAPDLAARRASLVSALQGAGFEASRAHGFTPHMTLAHLAPGAPTPDPVPPRAVTFARVATWAGWWQWSCSLGPGRGDGKEHDVSERDREPGGQFAPEGKGGDKKPEEPKKAEEKVPAKEATPSTEGQEKQASPAGGEGETKRPERMRGGVVGAVGVEYSMAVSDAVDGDGPRKTSLLRFGSARRTFTAIRPMLAYPTPGGHPPNCSIGIVRITSKG